MRYTEARKILAEAAMELGLLNEEKHSLATLAAYHKNYYHDAHPDLDRIEKKIKRHHGGKTLALVQQRSHGNRLTFSGVKKEGTAMHRAATNALRKMGHDIEHIPARRGY